VSYKFDYTHQVFTRVIDILVTQSGKDRNKIKTAYSYHIIKLEEKDFPEELKKDFNYLKSTIADKNKIADWDEENRYGSIYHSCSSLNSSSIKKIKKTIWRIYEFLNSEAIYS
jgi:hypothetical protein